MTTMRHLLDAVTGRRFEFLSELRRNPHLNRKTDALVALDRFRGKANIFVSFTSNVGAASHQSAGTAGKKAVAKNVDGEAQDAPASPFTSTAGAKLGVNPKSTYHTPAGVYAYPLDYVRRLGMKVPFAGSEPYIWVFTLRSGSRLLDLKSYSSEQLSEDTGKLATLFPGQAHLLVSARNQAKVQTYGGILWNLTRFVAQGIAQESLHREAMTKWNAEYQRDWSRQQKHIDFELQRRGFDRLEDEEAWQDERNRMIEDWQEEYHAENPEPDSSHLTFSDALDDKAARVWNSVWRKLGYDGAVDPADDGIIHHNEPTQAVFFNPRAIQPLELVHNIRPKTEDDVDWYEVWKKTPSILAAGLRSGKISAEQAIGFFNRLPGFPAKIGYEKLPPAAQEWVRQNLMSCVGATRPENIEGVAAWKVQPDVRTAIEILEHHPRWAMTFREFRPLVWKFMLRNAGEYISYVLRTPVPDSDVLAMAEKTAMGARTGGGTTFDSSLQIEIAKWRPSLAIQCVDRMDASTVANYIVPKARERGALVDLMVRLGTSGDPYTFFQLQMAWTKLTPAEAAQVAPSLPPLRDHYYDRFVKYQPDAAPLLKRASPAAD